MATSDHELIRNTIARYAIGVDHKDWDTFSKAFLENAIIIFPEPIGTLNGITTIKATISAMVEPFQSQHCLSTQLIEITGGKTAEAITYVTNVLSGTGNDEGKSATSLGYYQDKLVKVIVDDREDWKISERKAFNRGVITGDLPIHSS
ncbi:small subunit of phenylpropionate dioxygenase protein [Colletotrichum incanum]|uniref:Small subunit of phenylpropionate dioxygenase protein n=1 Tax=Colletotrichum incanum TaxID=1573173 RepID=A0A166ZSE1_COLIC|nr:small subunit of phenylpropionate dioxygenase protein [Colletotrichum incanum]